MIYNRILSLQNCSVKKTSYIKVNIAACQYKRATPTAPCVIQKYLEFNCLADAGGGVMETGETALLVLSQMLLAVLGTFVNNLLIITMKVD